MAEDTTTTEKPPDKPPESPPKPPADKPPTPEPRTEERRSEPPTEPATAKCPDCRARVDVDELDTHRFLVHKVDRRAKPKPEGDDKPTDDKRKGPPKRPEPKPEGTSKPRRPASRWAEVGWKR